MLRLQRLRDVALDLNTRGVTGYEHRNETEGHFYAQSCCDGFGFGHAIG